MKPPPPPILVTIRGKMTETHQIKTLTRAAWGQLSPKAKAEFFKAGGRLVNE